MIVKPVKLEDKFSPDTLADIKGYVLDALRSVVNSHRERVRTKIQSWNRLYRGIPKEETRSRPWENASNIVVQVIGSHTDTLTAWILNSIYELDPIFPIKAIGSWADDIQKEQYREALELFLHESAIDANVLDMYRVSQLWISDGIKYGFKAIKIGYENIQEAVVSPAMDMNITKFSGPRPENVNYEDFFVSNDFKTLEEATFKAELLYFTEQDLRQRAYSGKFNRDAVEKLFSFGPDDNGYNYNQRDANNDVGIKTQASTKAFDRWYVYECWVKFFHAGRVYSLVCYYHLKSETYLGSYFNILPNNEEPYVALRLGYRTSDMYGVGFCELMEHAQEEATAIHNRRNDNATIANLRMLRVSPKATRIGSNFRVHPFAVIRAESDEVEAIQLGDVYPSTFQEEQLILSEVADRVGVTPAVTGLGSGTVRYQNKSAGSIYSSQGTFAMLQAGTRRVNLDTMDMRYAHLKAGQKILNLYSFFGVDKDTLSAFGQMGARVQEALQEFKSKKFALSVRAATASINRELERQNDVFLMQILNRHVASQGQYLQAILGPQTPPQIKEFLVDVFSKSNALMKKIFRNFGYDNPNSFLPKSTAISQIEKQKTMLGAIQNASAAPNTGIPSGESSGGFSFDSESSIPADSGVNEGVPSELDGVANSKAVQ